MTLLRPFISLAICMALMRATFAADATSTPRESQAIQVMDYIHKTFLDPRTGLYLRSTNDRKPDYVWRQAAMFSALVGAARHEPAKYRPLLDKHFDAMQVYWDAKAPIPGYEPAPTLGNGHDKYYDDNAWLVITFCEAYQLTGEKRFLSRARETANFVASGWDDKAGGGIWWHQAHKDDSKNTCSNGPSAVGFLALARFEPKADAERWTNLAQRTIDWTVAHLQADDGLFDDRIIVSTGEVKKEKLTYNSALMLRACLDLYRQTGQAKYFDQAKRIGKAADWFLDAKTGVYRDPLKWSYSMVEADLDLYRATNDAAILKRAQTNIDADYAAWKREPSPEMMSNAALARMLWLLADIENAAGKAVAPASREAVSK